MANWSFEDSGSITVISNSGRSIEIDSSHSIALEAYYGEKTVEYHGEGSGTSPEYIEDTPSGQNGYYCEAQITGRSRVYSNATALLDPFVFGITVKISTSGGQIIYANSGEATSTVNRYQEALICGVSNYSSLAGNFTSFEVNGNGATRFTPSGPLGISDRYGIAVKCNATGQVTYSFYKNGTLLGSHFNINTSINSVRPLVMPGAFIVDLFTTESDILYLPSGMVPFDGGSITPIAEPANIPINFNVLLSSNIIQTKNIPISFSDTLNPRTVYPRYVPINFNDLKEFINTTNIPITFKAINPVSFSGNIGDVSIPVLFNGLPIVSYGFNIPLLSKSILPTTIPKPIQYRKMYSAFSYPDKDRIAVASISGYMDLREETITFTVNGIGFFDIENKESVSIYIDYKNNVDSFSIQWLNENIEALSFTEFNDINKRYSLTCRRKNYTKESAKELSIPQKTISGYTQKKGLRGIEFPEIKPFIFPGDTITISETGEQYDIKRIEFSISAYAKTFYIYE